MISLTDRPGCGPRGAAQLPGREVCHCASNAWQKSSTSQKTSVSRSNMVISHGVVVRLIYQESLIQNQLMRQNSLSGLPEAVDLMRA